MDAAAVEGDVRLYKASAELLAELQAKLPLLIATSSGTTPRKWVLYHKTAEILRLLDSFQEWPQLLDPILASLVDSLVKAFLAYCVQNVDEYHSSGAARNAQSEPLPRSICRVLYVLCKVRSYKVISRLLNNEPKYVETLLTCFRTWDIVDSDGKSVMTWEERYIMLLWLSHLMLAPFDLSTISGFSSEDTGMPTRFARLQLPEVAKVLLRTALKYLHVPSKDHEAASLVVVRLALRGDMQKIGMLGAAIDWCLADVLSDENALLDQYRQIGTLRLLYGLMNSASSTEAEPHLQRIFSTCDLLINHTSDVARHARQSAVTRKLLIKIVRISILHAISLEDNSGGTAGGLLEDALETGIQALLEWLSDPDTPVRQAASKALSMVVLKLVPSMADEVIEAVLGCMNENMLLQDIKTGKLSAITDLLSVDLKQFKKNVNAVDPLKWHGAMLTLGHLLFRRSPPPETLSDILDALLIGLAFEQRSNVGTSVGVAVRDAACFGIWSLARKYTTKEVEAARLSAGFFATHQYEGAREYTTLQIVATELVVAACLDPSGNLRRGASAALQELIGRHPDSILHGIPVVQRVDYHAVARRSRALLEVTVEVSELDNIYHQSLLYQLLEWRGSRAVDADARRQAAIAIGMLFSKATKTAKLAFTKHLLSQIQDLRSSNIGTNAAARHGLLLALAAVIGTVSYSDGVRNGDSDLRAVHESAVSSFDSLTGTVSSRVTADLLHVLEASARLIGVAVEQDLIDKSCLSSNGQSSTILQILDRCTTASEDDIVTDAAASASAAVLKLLPLNELAALLKEWVPATLPKHRSTITCKGRLKSLSSLFASASMELPADVSTQCIGFLTQIVASELTIETRINAMGAIGKLLRTNETLDAYCTALVFEGILQGLTDYTTDQRGDIGSLLRLASIDAVGGLNPIQTQTPMGKRVSQVLIRLAAEKSTKVRAAAWSCFQTVEGQLGHYTDETDVTSITYFQGLLDLFIVDSVRDDLMKGIVSSIGGAAEDVSHTASSALVLWFSQLSTASQQLEFLHLMLTWLLQQLAAKTKAEDREVVPLLDTFCLIVENFGDETQQFLVEHKPTILNLVKALQNPVADIGRIQSLLRLLSHLSQIIEYRAETVDMITRKLLHKWPKVRQAAADAIWLIPKVVPVHIDWNLPATANKDEVVVLRKQLGVAGSSAVTASTK